MKSGIEKVREELVKQNVEAVFISSVPQITHLTSYANFSIEEREGYLIITKKEQFIITDPRLSEGVEEVAPGFKVLVRSQENSTQKHLELIKKRYQIEALGIEENNLTVAEYRALKKVFSKLKHFELHNLRLRKSVEEIKKIAKACLIGDRAFDFIKGQIKPGMKEVEVANLLEGFIKAQGGKLSFETIVAFGKNSAIPHHATGVTKLKDLPGQFIKLDFGVKFENYCSDMTRTVFYGIPSARQKEIYQTVLDSQSQAVEFIENHLAGKSGLPLKAADVDKVARDYIVAQGFPTIPHSLGHGIGIEVHEAPWLSPKSQYNLEEGMVFSIEPGIYLSGFGGVRIEDLYAIQGGKLKQLTKAPKELTVI
jgi:Xaa-Pro aminopeptidase